MTRGQASVTAIEAAIGVLLVMSITFTFALGVPSGDERETQAQLDTYATDAATILENEPPRHQEQTRVTEVLVSEDAFDREKDDLEDRIDRILPPNLAFAVETEYGSIGYPIPDGVKTGEATILTPHGELTLRVWYI